MVIPRFRLAYAAALGLVVLLPRCAPVHDATPASCPTGQESSGAMCVCVSTQAAPVDGQCPPICSVDDCVDDDNPCTEPACPSQMGACINETVANLTPCDDGDGEGECLAGVCFVPEPQWQLGVPFIIGGGLDEIVGPEVALAANGEGMAMWAQGDALMVSHFGPEDGWQEPIVVEEDFFPDRPFSLGVDALGNAVIVYTRVEATSIDARAVRFDSGAGLWGPPEVISRDGSFANYAFVRVTPDGDVWAGWSEEPGDILLRRTRTTALDWDSPIVVPSTDGAPKHAPRAFLTDGGRGAVVFYGHDAGGVADSAWVATIGPEDSVGTAVRVDPDVGEVVYAQVGATEDGELMVVWEQADDIWYAHFADDQWEPAALVEAGSGTAFSSVVAADGAGNFMVAWCQSRDMRTRRLVGAEQRWEDMQILRISDTDDARRPSLVATPEGEAWLVWVEGQFIRMSHFTVESRWSIPENISPPLESSDPPPIHAPWLSRAPDGTLAVVWADGRNVWAWADKR
jgi:hypothetical protein